MAGAPTFWDALSPFDALMPVGLEYRCSIVVLPLASLRIKASYAYEMIYVVL